MPPLCPTLGLARSSTSCRSASSADPTLPSPHTTPAWTPAMSARSKGGASSRGAASSRAISVWVIALLVALVATVQIRSQAEVERSFAGTDTASLAFLIDNLHRANDSLAADAADLTQRKAALQSGSDTAADQALTDEANRLRAAEGLVPVHGSGVVLVVNAVGLQAL